MATTLARGGTLRHLRELFDDGTSLGLGDGQLLARYAATRDEAAFAALVARHGPIGGPPAGIGPGLNHGSHGDHGSGFGPADPGRSR